MDLTNLAYVGPCSRKSLIFVCIVQIFTLTFISLHRTEYVVLKSITDSPAVTTLSFQYSLYSQQRTSKPPESHPGKFIGLNETAVFSLTYVGVKNGEEKNCIMRNFT